MLSLPRCRELLGPIAPVSDEVLTRIREQFYTVAEAALDVLPSSGSTGTACRGSEIGADHPIAMLSEQDRIQVEERAAILEFETGDSRDRAERRAVSEYCRRFGRT